MSSERIINAPDSPAENPTRPPVSDVAALLRARTKDDHGQEIGAFTEATRPTDVEVEELITLAEGDVRAQIGSDLSEMQTSAARSQIALRAAMLVELSYFPEQVRTDRSAYVEYKRMYDDGMAALISEVESGASGASYGSVAIRSWTMAGVHDFPPETGPPVVDPPVVNPLVDVVE